MANAEIVENMRTLCKTAVGAGQSVWFTFVAEAEPSEAMQRIVRFVNDQEPPEPNWYSIIVKDGVKPHEIYAAASETIVAPKQVYGRLLDYIAAEAIDMDEAAQVIVLWGEGYEVETGSSLDFLVQSCNNRGIPVVDMGDQMLGITFKDDPDADEADSPETDDGEEPVEQTEVDEQFKEIMENNQIGEGSSLDELTRERKRLMTFSRKELTRFVAERNVGNYVTDGRAKGALVDALMRDAERAYASEHPVDTTDDALPDDEAEVMPPWDDQAAAIDREEADIDALVAEAEEGYDVETFKTRPNLVGTPDSVAARHQSQSWATSRDEAADANENPISPMAVSIAIVDGMLQVTIDPRVINREFLLKIKGNGALEFA